MRLTLKKPPRPRIQGVLPFQERTDRLDRLLKRTILCLTVVAVAGVVFGTPVIRRSLGALADTSRDWAYRTIGVEPAREEVEAERSRIQARASAYTLDSLTRFYRDASPEMRRLFDITGMDPKVGLVVTGRTNHGFLLSSKVFERDDRGRSYRFRPNLRSIWLRQITLVKGPFGLFLVPDTPQIRAAAGGVGAIVDEGSAQVTNSWGLRGPEPDPDAALRGIVLGDSFMEGMFVGDEDTPPLNLERALRATRNVSVSVLNTGHVGYAPEQYLATLREFGPRFRPDFVVVSVCPNDFGGDFDVLEGAGDDWPEAMYNLNEIATWCRSKRIPFVLVPVPTFPQILGMRRDGRYPGRISDLFQAGPGAYLDLLDPFVNAHLRLEPDRRLRGQPSGRSALYNLDIADNHLSPTGSALWARLVAERLALILGDKHPVDLSKPRDPGDQTRSGEPFRPKMGPTGSLARPGPGG